MTLKILFKNLLNIYWRFLYFNFKKGIFLVFVNFVFEAFLREGEVIQFQWFVNKERFASLLM